MCYINHRKFYLFSEKQEKKKYEQKTDSITWRTCAHIGGWADKYEMKRQEREATSDHRSCIVVLTYEFWHGIERSTNICALFDSVILVDDFIFASLLLCFVWIFIPNSVLNDSEKNKITKDYDSHYSVRILSLVFRHFSNRVTLRFDLESCLRTK